MESFSNLVELIAVGNNLFYVDTYNNSSLEVLIVDNNLISNLYTNNNTNLRKLSVNNNLLHYIDLSENQNLFQLKVDSEIIWVHLLEKTTLGYKLGFRGAIMDTVVRTTRERELSTYMLPKVEEDTSMFVASPMPGVVASIAVKPGDKVEIGQEIGVIEAMKMHNSIRAEKAAIVAEVVVATGDSIDVDQKLIIYEE